MQTITEQIRALADPKNAEFVSRLMPQIPPEHPHDSLANLASSAYLLGEARPWITGDSSSPRRAAVLGANFDATDPVGAAAKGGRSAVIVLEEEPEVRS